MNPTNPKPRCWPSKYEIRQWDDEARKQLLAVKINPYQNEETVHLANGQVVPVTYEIELTGLTSGDTRRFTATKRWAIMPRRLYRSRRKLWWQIAGALDELSGDGSIYYWTVTSGQNCTIAELAHRVPALMKEISAFFRSAARTYPVELLLTTVEPEPAQATGEGLDGNVLIHLHANVIFRIQRSGRKSSSQVSWALLRRGKRVFRTWLHSSREVDCVYAVSRYVLKPWDYSPILQARRFYDFFQAAWKTRFTKSYGPLHARMQQVWKVRRGERRSTAVSPRTGQQAKSKTARVMDAVPQRVDVGVFAIRASDGNFEPTRVTKVYSVPGPTEIFNNKGALKTNMDPVPWITVIQWDCATWPEATDTRRFRFHDLGDAWMHSLLAGHEASTSVAELLIVPGASVPVGTGWRERTTEQDQGKTWGWGPTRFFNKN